MNVAAVQNPDPLRSPGGIDFLVGFLQYELVGAGVEGAATLTLGRPATADIVYQFGALTPFDPIASFYEFAFDGITGAEIVSDSVVLHLVDGARGDRDLSADGVIRGLTGLGRVLGTDVSAAISDAPRPSGRGPDADVHAHCAERGSERRHGCDSDGHAAVGRNVCQCRVRSRRLH